jgi:hypothetical protein
MKIPAGGHIGRKKKYTPSFMYCQDYSIKILAIHPKFTCYVKASASPREGMVGRRMERQRTIPGRRAGNRSLNLFMVVLLRRLPVRIWRALNGRSVPMLPLKWGYRHLAGARSAPAVAQEGRDIQILSVESTRLEFSILLGLLLRSRRDRVLTCFSSG